MNISKAFKILLVDDDKVFRDVTAEQIRDILGLTPQLASDGDEAETIIHSWTPHILITDTNMPKLNGLELIQRVRPRHPNLVIFSFFSGLIGSSVSAKDVLAMGANFVFAKEEVKTHLLPVLKKLVC